MPEYPGEAPDAASLVPHTHVEADVTGLSGDLASKAAIAHSHVEGDVTSLTADLATKAVAADPFGFGIPVTSWPRERATNAALAANQGRWMRVVGGATITKVGLQVGVQSGNISVAVYSNTGSGVNAAPGTRIGTSGAVACPAVGYAEVSLGGSAVCNHGDWLFLSADNATASFNAGNVGQLNTNLGAGLAYLAAAAHPAPSPVPALTAFAGDAIILKGIA